MSDFEQPAPVSEYGRARRQSWLADLARGAEAMTQAAAVAHQADHDAITAGQHGLFGATTGQQQAAELAARAVTVGGDWGQAREIQRQGPGMHGFNEVGQGVPTRVDLRFIDQQGQAPASESPLARWLRERG